MSLLEKYMHNFYYSKFPWRSFKNEIVNIYVFTAIAIVLIGSLIDYFFYTKIFIFLIQFIGLVLIVSLSTAFFSKKFYGKIIKSNLNYEDVKYSIYFLICIGFGLIFIVHSGAFFRLLWKT